MVSGSGTKLSNGIVRSKIDLPKVCFKNVESAFVEPYKASEISKITNTQAFNFINLLQLIYLKNLQTIFVQIISHQLFQGSFFTITIYYFCLKIKVKRSSGNILCYNKCMATTAECPHKIL